MERERSSLDAAGTERCAPLCQPLFPIMVYVCQCCPLRFQESQALLTHFLADHMSESKPELQDSAPAALPEKRSPSPQQDSSEPTEDSTCKDCGKVFSSKYNLDRHVQLHKGVRYPCAICGKVYSQKYAWGQHMKLAHNKAIPSTVIRSGERTWKSQARCPYCSESFPSQATIEEHMKRTHLFPLDSVR